MSARRHLSEYQFGKVDFSNSSMGQITATHQGEHAGIIQWDRQKGSIGRGEVIDVNVEKEHRRNGVATELYRRAQQADSSVRHSTFRTDTGDAWAKSIGDHVPSMGGYEY